VKKACCLLLFVNIALFGVETNFIALDAEELSVITSIGPSLDYEASPCCTFNIALSLLGFECGILSNENEPVWSYDGSSVFMEAQKASQSPKSWMELSVVWYSKQLIQKIGYDLLQQSVAFWSYGNQDVTGEDGNHFATAHLSSSLKITPRQQVQFLQRFVNKDLSVSSHSLQMTKKILFNKDLDSGWKLYGKTGSGFDGCEENKIAWYVGWIERGEERRVFALFSRHLDVFPTKEERVDAVMKFLQSVKAL
jgi:beta-lactamase class D